MKQNRLKKIRELLQSCYLENQVTDASLKKCLLEVISELDCEIEKKKTNISSQHVMKLVGKILDKLPWIVTLFEKLK